MIHEDVVGTVKRRTSGALPEAAASTTDNTAAGSSAHVVDIGAGLKAFCNAYEVDGRVSWHAPDVRGFAASNCYLVQEGSQALLVDTGLTVHRTALMDQLTASLHRSDTLDILVLRQGEFDSMCNLLPLVQATNVKTLYGQFADVLSWGDFLPGHDIEESTDDPKARESIVLSRAQNLSLGPGGRRQLTVFRPVLRLLSTHWAYDESTHTLFTSDSFSYVVQPTAAGPWRVTDDDDATTLAHVREHLRTTRYWWLEESDVSTIRRELAAVFTRYDVEHIAPAFGAVISGRSAVERHVQFVDEGIAQLGRSPVA